MRRAIAAVGRALVTVGLLILLFVAFQLWGTGIVTARAQDDMRAEFERERRDRADLDDLDDDHLDEHCDDDHCDGATPTLPVPQAPAPAEGDWIGTIEIPEIGVDKIFVEGTSRGRSEAAGPAITRGHRCPVRSATPRSPATARRTASPSSISTSSRRATRSSPHRPSGATRTRSANVLIVNPEDTYVVDNTADAQLTLTTCHPKFSARQRLVVQAALVPDESSALFEGAPLHEGEEDRVEPTLAEGLDGESKPLGPAYGWGTIVAVVGLAWWWVFRRWRHPLTWLAGVLPFLVVLFGFYYFLERALPAGY